MDIWHAIILGIVEGLTEFLPISSTAHLIISSQILGLTQTEFLKSFQVIIQLGAILAVLYVYLKRLLGSKTLWMRVLAGFLPTAVIGLLLYRVIRDVFFENNLIIGLALILGGIFLIFFNQEDESSDSHEIESLSLKKAACIGLIQSLSIIPGVSRAAATIIGSQIMGLTRRASVEFSFLLALPTIGAAALYDLFKTGISFSHNELSFVFLGFITSFVFALLTIKWLLAYVTTHTFKGFGIYRIVIGLLFILFFAL